jgi:hypothetical protein
MARDPGSLWSPLKETGTQGHYTKTQFIVHSTGDRLGARATFAFFNGPTENESTFIVGASPDDPTRQLLDSAERADANIAANEPAISVEVVGTGDDDYTPWQVSELERLARWAMEQHPGITPQIIPTPTGPGFGWHVMWGAPSVWTGAKKVCPGALRIRRLKEDVFPAIFGGPAHSTREDEDVFKLYAVKGAKEVYFGGPGVWLLTPNEDWMTTAHLTIPTLSVVTLPTADHLTWARDFCLNVLAGKRNAAAA